MRKLNGLKDSLIKPNDRTESVPTYLDICVDSLSHMPAKGVESVKNWKLAIRLTDLQEPFEIEDAEFDRLQQAIEANPCGYLSWTHGQMMIRAAEWRENNASRGNNDRGLGKGN